MVMMKTENMLIIERTYGKPIEELVWSDAAVRLAHRWDTTTQTIYDWRKRFPRTDELLLQVQCVCNNKALDYRDDIVSCSVCEQVERWLDAHKRYIKGG